MGHRETSQADVPPSASKASPASSRVTRRHERRRAPGVRRSYSPNPGPRMATTRCSLAFLISAVAGAVLHELRIIKNSAKFDLAQCVVPIACFARSDFLYVVKRRGARPDLPPQQCRMEAPRQGRTVDGWRPLDLSSERHDAPSSTARTRSEYFKRRRLRAGTPLASYPIDF